MKFGTSFMVLVLSVVSWSLQAQESEEFSPHGKAFGTIFANYHHGINSETTDDAAFELVRAYLGYQHYISEEFSAKINVDIGSPNDLSEYSKLRRYAYFKNAYLQYKKDKLTIQFGLISLKHFKLQEKYWERRYMKKTFADEYKLGSSADLGTSITYKFSSKVESDVTIMNGEGYNNLQTDDVFKYGFGTTYSPFESFTLRGYYDITKDEISQTTAVLLASYTYNKNFNICFEYQYQSNNKFKEDQDIYGYSIFGKYNINKQFQLFARFDKLQSNILDGETNPWQLSKDGSALITGIQFSPVKNVKIALDYQDWYPWAANSANQSYIYLDLEVKL